jgi:glycosyltransferase involved in cell wall biosynthesis
VPLPNLNFEVSDALDATGHRLVIRGVPDGLARPLWSVMIPTFHCAQFLRQTLESVLSQDPGPDVMQIEVIDDCSTQDDPESVVRAAAGERVHFFRQPKNVGHTRNFETCLQRARGHLVHLLHGDDAVLYGFYQKMAQPFAENRQLGAAFCRNVIIDEDGNWLEISHIQQRYSGILPDLLERLAVKAHLQTPAMVVRREVYEVVGGFDRRLSWTEDWEMWARIAAHYPVWYKNEPLALYRTHNTSNSARYIRSGENLRDVERLFEIVEKYVPNRRGKRLCQEGREHWAGRGLDTARRLLGDRDFTAAASQVRESLTLCFNLRVLARLVALLMWAARRAIVHSISGNLRQSRHS